MTIFKHIKNFFDSKPEEKILGYSSAELRMLFRNAGPLESVKFSKVYPEKFSLEPEKIHAFYVAVLITEDSIENFMTLVNSHFLLDEERRFQGIVVVQSESKKGDERLCFLVADEFEGHVVKCVTNSVGFLNDIDQSHFAPPPPWVAFRNYDPSWWGGSMQGAQGYYENNYFHPFFTSLNAEQKKAYCEKFNASRDWAEVLKIFYDECEN